MQGSNNNGASIINRYLMTSISILDKEVSESSIYKQLYVIGTYVVSVIGSVNYSVY